MANLWKDAIPPSRVSNDITSPTATATCPEYFVPAGTLAFYDSNSKSMKTVDITASGLYYPNCEARTNPKISNYESLIGSSYLGYHDPFHGSVIPIAYSLSATTVVAWLLFILLLISQKPRPLFQKFATLFVAVSLTVFLAQATQVLESQYYKGYHDSEELRQKIFGGLAFRILEVLMTLIVWLAHLQVLLRLFDRQKERQIIKVIGIVLAVIDTTLWCLVNFFVPYHSDNKYIRDIIPVLAYLFQISLSVMYLGLVALYSFRKRQFAYSFRMQSKSKYNKYKSGFSPSYTNTDNGIYSNNITNSYSSSNNSSRQNSLLVAIISLVSVSLPLVFFIIDISQYWLTGWSEFIRWVSDVSASVVVWEWVDVIEKQERQQQKNGVLGRPIFDEEDQDFDKMRFALEGKRYERNKRGRKRKAFKRSHPNNNNDDSDSDHSDAGNGGTGAGSADVTGITYPSPVLSTSTQNQRSTNSAGDHPSNSIASQGSSSLGMPQNSIQNNTSTTLPRSQEPFTYTTNNQTPLSHHHQHTSRRPRHYGAGGGLSNASSSLPGKYWPFTLFFKHSRDWVISRPTSSAASSSTSYGPQICLNELNNNTNPSAPNNPSTFPITSLHQASSQSSTENSRNPEVIRLRNGTVIHTHGLASSSRTVRNSSTTGPNGDNTGMTPGNSNTSASTTTPQSNLHYSNTNTTPQIVASAPTSSNNNLEPSAPPLPYSSQMNIIENPSSPTNNNNNNNAGTHYNHHLQLFNHHNNNGHSSAGPSRSTSRASRAPSSIHSIQSNNTGTHSSMSVPRRHTIDNDSRSNPNSPITQEFNPNELQQQHNASSIVSSCTVSRTGSTRSVRAQNAHSSNSPIMQNPRVVANNDTTNSRQVTIETNEETQRNNADSSVNDNANSEEEKSKAQPKMIKYVHPLRRNSKPSSVSSTSTSRNSNGNFHPSSSSSASEDHNATSFSESASHPSGSTKLPNIREGQLISSAGFQRSHSTNNFNSHRSSTTRTNSHMATIDQSLSTSNNSGPNTSAYMSNNGAAGTEEDDDEEMYRPIGHNHSLHPPPFQSSSSTNNDESLPNFSSIIPGFSPGDYWDDKLPPPPP